MVIESNKKRIIITVVRFIYAQVLVGVANL
jgi:hypothetical protein